jgi:hypothetical protein
MKVRELLTLLSRADPEDIVVFQASSESLLLISIRPGMNQRFEDLTVLTLEEKELLRAMHIQW